MTKTKQQDPPQKLSALAAAQERPGTAALPGTPAPLQLHNRLKERHKLPLGGEAFVEFRCLPAGLRAFIRDSSVNPESGLFRQFAYQLLLLRFSVTHWEGLECDGQPWPAQFSSEIIEGTSYDVLHAECLDPFPGAALASWMTFCEALNHFGRAEKKSSNSIGGSPAPTDPPAAANSAGVAPASGSVPNSPAAP